MDELREKRRISELQRTVNGSEAMDERGQSELWTVSGTEAMEERGRSEQRGTADGSDVVHRPNHSDQLWFAQWIAEDGKLITHKSMHREPIYEKLDGTKVERCVIDGRSFIYKPISAAQVAQREQWAYDTIVRRLRGIRVPRIMASSNDQSKQQWLIYEDFGPLRHCIEPQARIEAAGWAGQWHELPVDLVSPSLVGHSPPLEQVVLMVKNELELLPGRIDAYDADATMQWASQLDAYVERRGQQPPVVSHGDYHPYNAAIGDEHPIIIDWEYVHLNDRYWDLYSLLDMTSYRYSVDVLTKSERTAALQRYWQHGRHSPNSETFIMFEKGYLMYTAIYSAWIAGLIEHDLLRGLIPQADLLAQRKATSAIFNDCLQQLLWQEKEIV